MNEHGDSDSPRTGLLKLRVHDTPFRLTQELHEIDGRQLQDVCAAVLYPANVVKGVIKGSVG